MDQDKEAASPAPVTALELAALHEGNLNVLRRVLKRRAPLESVFAPDAKGFGCVHHAARRGDLEFLTTLRRAGIGSAWLLGANHLGTTPLHVALEWCRLEFIGALLHGLSPADRATALQARDKRGWNVLHLAVYSDQLLGILHLNELMKDMPGGIQALMTEDKQGRTPAALAVAADRHFALRTLAMVDVPEQTLWQAYVKHRNPPEPLADWRTFLSLSVKQSASAGTGEFVGQPWVRDLRKVHRQSGTGPQLP